MYFTFTSTGVMLDDNEVCKVLEGWSIFVIPDELKSGFTSKEFMKASGLTLSSSQTALNVLHSVGAVVRTGKSGNTYVYSRSETP